MDHTSQTWSARFVYFFLFSVFIIPNAGRRHQPSIFADSLFNPRVPSCQRNSPEAIKNKLLYSANRKNPGRLSSMLEHKIHGHITVSLFFFFFKYYYYIAEQPDAVFLVQRNAGYFTRYQHAAEFQLENHSVPASRLAFSLPVHGQRYFIPYLLSQYVPSDVRM